MKLTGAELAQFATDGFIVIPNVVDEALLDAADTEIDELIKREPPPPGTIGKHFWFLPPDGLPAAHAALRGSPSLGLAEQLTAPSLLELNLGHKQIALNIPPYSHQPGGPHIDSRVQQHPEQTAPDSFMLLAGVFLTDEHLVDSGNLWAWRGSHRTHERLFPDRGPDVLMATFGHISLLDDPPPLPAPVPVLGQRGDVLLAHFLLGHNTKGNLGPSTRRMLYYRLSCPDHGQRWADTFTEYPRLRTPGQGFQAPPITRTTAGSGRTSPSAWLSQNCRIASRARSSTTGRGSGHSERGSVGAVVRCRQWPLG